MTGHISKDDFVVDALPSISDLYSEVNAEWTGTVWTDFDSAVYVDNPFTDSGVRSLYFHSPGGRLEIHRTFVSEYYGKDGFKRAELNTERMEREFWGPHIRSRSGLLGRSTDE